ncbi:hypothetical protein V8G54_005529, partial [Vigna mungo]
NHLVVAPSHQANTHLPQNNPKSLLNIHHKPLRQSATAFILIQTPWTSHLRHQSRTTMEACSFAEPVNRKARIPPPRETPKSGYNKKILAIPAAHTVRHNGRILQGNCLDKTLDLVHEGLNVAADADVETERQPVSASRC